MRNFTTIALNKKTAEQLKTLAQQKGVPQGVYIQKMIDFFIENSIDYVNGDVLLGAIVHKEIERVVKILRAYERDFFKPDFDTLKQLKASLLEVMSAAAEEIEEVKLQSDGAIKQKYDDLNKEFRIFQGDTGEVCTKIKSVLNSAKQTKKGIEIELLQAEKIEIDNKINTLLKAIYG